MGVVQRWVTAIIGASLVFVVAWTAWSRYGWPSGKVGADGRANVALGFAAAVSAAVLAGLAAWAGGRQRRSAPEPIPPRRGGEGNLTNQHLGVADQPTLGPVTVVQIGGNFVGAGAQVTMPTLADHTPVASTLASASVVIGDIPRAAQAFQHRGSILTQLSDGIQGDDPAVLCAVTGGRGIGKSQIAAAYARARVAERWPVVAWIVAESSDQILTGLAQLAEAVGVRPADTDSLDAARAARHYLQQLEERSLVVFDNATDPDILVPWLPSVGRTQVVITSVHREIRGLGIPFEVDLFSDGEALCYLRERTGLADDEGARSLAEEVGY